MASERSSEREAAERVAGRPGRPLGDAVFQRARQLRERARAWPAGDEPRNSAPCFRATIGRASWPDRTWRRPRRQPAPASRPAYARHASIERVGKTDLELAPGQPLLVDREPKPALLQQRGARIVPVPDAKYIHDVICVWVSACRAYFDFGFGL